MTPDDEITEMRKRLKAAAGPKAPVKRREVRVPEGRARFVFVGLWAALIASACWHYDDWRAIVTMTTTGYLWTGFTINMICRSKSFLLVVLWLPVLLGWSWAWRLLQGREEG